MCRFWMIVLVSALAAPAWADPCQDEVAALFDEGGAMDPFARPPHRMETVMYDAAGNATMIYDNAILTPLQTLSGVRGGEFRLTLDRESWTGPTDLGPWTKADVAFPEDRAGLMRRQLAEQKANLTDTVCYGIEEAYLHYGYATRTDPDDGRGGIWFGSRDEIWVDPDTGLLRRWQLTDFVSKFAPEPMKNSQVKMLEYDDDLALPEPPG